MISYFEAELLGALTGDGFIGNYGKRKNQFVIEMTGDSRHEKEYFLYLKNIFESLFDNINIPIRNRVGNTLVMKFYSKKAYYFFREKFDFPTGKKGNISVPKQILQNDNLMRYFIRGLFDTDGCLFFDKRKKYAKPYPRIIIYTTSHNLFKEVSIYLQKYFKIHTRITRRKGVKPSLIIEIYGHEQLEQWKQFIGFSNLKHISKLFASVAQS